MDRVLQEAEASLKAGDLARAEALCQQALMHSSGNPAALRLLGLSRLEAARPAEAIPLLREALQSDPDDLRVLDTTMKELMALEDYPQTEAVLRQALAVDDNLPVAHLRLGATLGRQGRWSEAAEAFRKATQCNPQFADAYHDLGDALTKLHRPLDAIGCFQRALTIAPENANTHNSLGFALQNLGRWKSAATRYERALALDPGFAKAHYNLGLLRLFNQEFGVGWEGYEQRLQCPPVRATLREHLDTLDLYERLPRWLGPQERDVREVAVWSEQAIGDQILFSTLIPELLACGVPLLYEVDRRLLKAYERAFPEVRFVPKIDPLKEELTQANRVVLAGSLPRLFRRSREDFARQPASLLRALPERVAHYERRMAGSGRGPRVALSWSSTRADWWVHRKSAKLAEFNPLLKMPGVQFVDVQYGDTGAERAAVQAATGTQLLHFDDVDYYNNLEELLAILGACDLVITTSNATAHLAGVLGKRTWVMYLADQAPFHYWAHGGDYRALWYPTVEIISAPELAEWPSLLQVVASKLRAEGVGGERPEARAAAAGVELASAADWLARARAMRLEGRLAAAVEACRRALEKIPEDAQAWNELAHALRWQGRLDEARAAAERARDADPRLAEAWFNLAAVLASRNEPQAAITAYRKALELKPDFAEAWSNLGEALAAIGDKEGEIGAYRRAIDVNPGLAPVWSNLGNALAEAGRIEEAVPACRRATELDPSFAPGWNNLGNAQRLRGGHAEAVRAFERAVDLVPRSAEAWSNLGCALLDLGELDRSLDAQRRALDIDPEMASAHYRLGVVHERRQQYAPAASSYRCALEIAPAFEAARAALARVLPALEESRQGQAPTRS